MKADQLWRLPGPASLIREAVRELEEGRSVILVEGENRIASIASCLQREFTQSELRPINLNVGSASEISDNLFERFQCSARPGSIRNVRMLAQAENFKGYSLLVQPRERAAVSAWIEFLMEYAEWSTTVATWERSVFCLLVPSAMEVGNDCNTIGLTTKCWDDYVSPVDTLILASAYLNGGWEVKSQLMANVIAKLSLWDLATCIRLSERSASSYDQLFEELALIATEREISGELQSILQRSWVCRRFEGRQRIHSAVHAALGNRGALEYRVWSAQVGVLFPLLEMARRGLIANYASQLKTPYTAKNGETIARLDDLELSHIVDQLRSRSAVPRAAIDRIQVLVRIRNALAHFEMVSHQLIDNSMFGDLVLEI